MAGLEVDIEDAVCEAALARWGVLNLKLNVRSNTGWPDRIFWLPCRPLLIEFKRPGEAPEPKQTFIHAQLIARGYDVQTHSDKEEALSAIKAALDASPVPALSCEVSARALLSGLVSRSRARQDKHQRRRK